ncbi:MAG: FAD-dependent oxidoreductase [Candidatus Omnitrophica bacterium]|nr:FAD-dependent oxidoreductase [Candidatus Omnitrophota bacterium]MCA9414784.1 FAD-dependent oxidoreductase [Candidatus Omnitrophota bacterium]MCB9783988.1 FAD-dependent oxidoreductase [Candidatus Omnitrophota bacterium]
MSSPNEPTIVIIGGVAGGASAATRARRCNENARILLYEKDEHVSFANCGLPYYIGEEIQDREKLLVGKESLFRDRFNIEVFSRHQVISIDRESKTVEVRNLETGVIHTEPYDKVILSPGASPFLPPLDGTDSRNVFSLRNLNDADRIKEYIETEGVKNAVMVGAGFIGLEMVEQLHEIGIGVSLVELADQVLGPLDSEVAAFVEEDLQNHGVHLYLNDSIDSLLVEEGKVGSVRLKTGAEIKTDLVLFGIGVRPTTQLAQDAGLEIGPMGGIRVDEYMRTSDPDIYAVGDAVEYPHGLLDHPMRVALGGPANRAGRIAGEHAVTGKSHPFTPVLGTAIVRVFGKTAGMTGLSEKVAAKEGIPHRSIYVAAGDHAGYYPGAEEMVLKLTYDPESAKVLGAQIVGGNGVDKRIDVIATNLHYGGTVHDLAGLDLAYAPPFGSAKDPVHLAGFVAQNDLDGSSPVLATDADWRGRTVVDIRTSKEFDSGHLPEAIHIPLDELRERMNEIDGHDRIAVVCESGKRGHVATRILKQHGFEESMNASGGMKILRKRLKGQGIRQNALA